MTRTFCDRCGKDCTNRFVEVGWTPTALYAAPRNTSVLCPDDAKQLDDWLTQTVAKDCVPTAIEMVPADGRSRPPTIEMVPAARVAV